MGMGTAGSTGRSRQGLEGAPIVNPDDAKKIDDENRRRAEANGTDFSRPDVYDEADLAAARRAQAEGNTTPLVTQQAKAAAVDKDPNRDPTLTDMLLRDIASGRVRRMRAGARRGTFGGSALNPYETPTLGG